MLPAKMRQSRISKSEAARRLAISRRTVIRLAQKGEVTCDRRGRVLFTEVANAWMRPSAKGARWRQLTLRHRILVSWRGSYWSPARLVKQKEWLSETGTDRDLEEIRRHTFGDAERRIVAYLKTLEVHLAIKALAQTTPHPQRA